MRLLVLPNLVVTAEHADSLGTERRLRGGLALSIHNDSPRPFKTTALPTGSPMQTPAC